VILQNFEDELIGDLATLSSDIHLTIKLLKNCGRIVNDVNVATYVEVRLAYWTSQLANLASQSNSNQDLASYIKGSSPFLAYTDALFILMKCERDFINRLFSKSQAKDAFQSTISNSIDLYLESAETSLGRFKRSFASGDESLGCGDSLFQLLDMIQGMASMCKEYDGLLTVFTPFNA
jgi:hypothetical protein